MTICSPLTYPDLSLTKNAARSASSSCVPKRPRGFFFLAISSNDFTGISRENAPSVGTGPGAIAFKRIPYLPHSTARLRVIFSTPAFATDEGTTYGEPHCAYVVVMLRTLALRFSLIQRLPQAMVAWIV